MQTTFVPSEAENIHNSIQSHSDFSSIYNISTLYICPFEAIDRVDTSMAFCPSKWLLITRPFLSHRTCPSIMQYELSYSIFNEQCFHSWHFMWCFFSSRFFPTKSYFISLFRVVLFFHRRLVHVSRVPFLRACCNSNRLKISCRFLIQTYIIHIPSILLSVKRIPNII